MSDVAALPVRQRRNFAPPPTIDGTRLFEKAGPELTICMHPERGFMIGDRGRRAVWSHDPPETLRMGVEHPDAFRTASSWYNDEEAREHLKAVLTRAEWEVVIFATIIADVAEPPESDGFANATASPTALCSVEACSRGLGRFAPLEHHALDPGMRRVAKPRDAMSRVSLAPVRG